MQPGAKGARSNSRLFFNALLISPLNYALILWDVVLSNETLSVK